MTKTKVWVLGGTGMLGSMVTQVLAEDGRFDVTATCSKGYMARHLHGHNGVSWEAWCVPRDPARRVWWGFPSSGEYIINCIGRTKPFCCEEEDPHQTLYAVNTNALTPYYLSVSNPNAHIIQIATDCVYTGKGVCHGYTEEADRDAFDLYGTTKRLGEVLRSNVQHLRCSIVGPESYIPGRYLLEWFRRQEDKELRGYINHLWNGVTTLHFARLVVGYITNGRKTFGIQHVVPADFVTKAELLRMFLGAYGNPKGQTIREFHAPMDCDRRLATLQEESNRQLWADAGYKDPLTIGQMVEELAAYKYKPLPLNVSKECSG